MYRLITVFCFILSVVVLLMALLTYQTNLLKYAIPSVILWGAFLFKKNIERYVTGNYY